MNIYQLKFLDGGFHQEAVIVAEDIVKAIGVLDLKSGAEHIQSAEVIGYLLAENQKRVPRLVCRTTY